MPREASHFGRELFERVADQRMPHRLDRLHAHVVATSNRESPSVPIQAVGKSDFNTTYTAKSSNSGFIASESSRPREVGKRTSCATRSTIRVCLNTLFFFGRFIGRLDFRDPIYKNRASCRLCQICQNNSWTLEWIGSTTNLAV